MAATPHTRGSTHRQLLQQSVWPGYPAYAGIDHYKKGLHVTVNWATPHTRGSTLQKELIKAEKEGYPAYAGIDPIRV